MSLFEMIGFITGIIGVWLTIKENPLNWPVGMMSVASYIFVFFDAQLYGDMLLQLFYIAVGLYGWYVWKSGGKNKPLQIAICNLRTMLWLVLASAITFAVALFFLTKTDTNVPYLDGLTTTLSLTATWLMARKYIEHWLVWIFVDAVYVGMYLYKALYLTAVLYFIFTALAIYGFLEWKKTMKLQAS